MAAAAGFLFLTWGSTDPEGFGFESSEAPGAGDWTNAITLDFLHVQHKVAAFTSETHARLCAASVGWTVGGDV